MRNLIILLIVLLIVGCRKDNVRDKTEETKTELHLILGEKVDCDNMTFEEGYLCKSETGRNYYCPRNADIKCFFTARFLLVDKPLEKPIPTQ